MSKGMTEEQVDLLNEIGCKCMDVIEEATEGKVDVCSALIFIAGQMFVTGMRNGLDISDKLCQSLDDGFNDYVREQIAKVKRIVGS